MFIRDITQHLKAMAKKYPIVTVTGPRQSGKTTLVKEVFPDKPYVNLEALDIRLAARNDPKEFLAFYPEGAVIDEAQHAPELFSYLQVRVDETDMPGQFILSGSQNFRLMESIAQSLAGRASIIELLPLSYHELNKPMEHPYDLIRQGFYPRMYKSNIDPSNFYKDYIQTYVERDLRQLRNIENLDQFQNFLMLCTGRIGQLLNISSLASDCGISVNTAKNWLSLLKTSYVLFTLKPYFKNYNRRVIKQPKLYFYDTGLACALMNITGDLRLHPQKGVLFENFVVAECLKTQLNAGKMANFYFWRDSNGHEIDLLFEQQGTVVPIEIKGASTIKSEFFDGLRRFEGYAGCNKGYLVYAGNEDRPQNVLSWQNLDKLF